MSSIASDRTTLQLLATHEGAALGGGAITAGRILEWIDKAAYACAVGWSRTYCVTVYVGNVRFQRPIHAGDLVELRARIIHTGSTSMQVHVGVSAADISRQEFGHAMDCLLVMVAVDDDGIPMAVPPWSPRDHTDRELQRRAAERVPTRRAIRTATMEQTFTDAGTTPRNRLRFLAAPGDANWGGKTHGGRVLRWIHEAGYAVAAGWSSTDATAVYSGGIHFLRPIVIGHIVEIDARVIHTEGVEMHVVTRVSSAPVRSPEDLELTTVCMSTFVDLPGGTMARPVRELLLRSEEDRRLDAHARAIISMRATIPPLGEALSRAVTRSSP